MAINLNTGNGIEVSAAADGSLYRDIFGSDFYVLEAGNQFKAEIVSSTSIRIADGDALLQGRHVWTKVNDSTTLNFEPAGQGKKRTDHVFIKYTNDSGVEKVEFEIIKGKTVALGENYNDEIRWTNDSIYYGGKQYKGHLLFVHINGLSIEEVIRGTSIQPSIDTILDRIKNVEKSLNNLNAKMNFRCVTKCGTIVVKIPTNSSSVEVFSDSDINNLLGITGASNANTAVSFANGDGQMTLHLDGATYLNGSWYATFNGLTTEETMCRVNYIIAYGGTSNAGGTVVTQSKTISPTVNEQVIRPDDGYDALSEVIVKEIPYKETTESGSTTVQIG